MLRSRSLKSRLVGLLTVVCAAVGVGLPAAPQATAASLTQITNFGTNPTGLATYRYIARPVGLVPKFEICVSEAAAAGGAAGRLTPTAAAIVRARPTRRDFRDRDRSTGPPTSSGASLRGVGHGGGSLLMG